MAGFFGMFDYTKPGKGVSKEDVDIHGIALYFDILWRRLGKLICLNLLYVLFSIPALVIYWHLSAYLITAFVSFYPGDYEPLALQFLNLFTTVSLLLLLGSGSPTAAMSYVLRKYVNDTHSWVWSDFWDNFKSNFVQGTLMFIINAVAFVVAGIALLFYANMGGLFSVVLTTLVGIMFIIFIMAQMYTYNIMASMKLKLRHIYKNALVLTVGRLPINICAIAVALIAIYLYNLVAVYELSLIAILIIFYTLPVYTQIFITNNTVNKYLIKPSEEAEKNSESEE